MKASFLIGILLFSTAIFTGCTSWQLKEQCEKTNWFEYSRDVANSGRYLEEDSFIKECKGVDRTNSVQLDLGFKSGRERYCTYESFLRNGENGEPVNFKMCDNMILYQMQERYAAGLNKFCTASVGYTYGANGKVYKNVCLKKDEETFLSSYFRGRKEFLEKTIDRLSLDIASLQTLQNRLSEQISLISDEIYGLPSPQECSTQNVYNSITKKSEKKTVCHESLYIQLRRSQLYSQIDPLRSQYRDHAALLGNEIKSLTEARTELTKIPMTYFALKLL